MKTSLPIRFGIPTIDRLMGRRGVDEANPVSAVEEPHIAIPCHIDQPFHRSSVALVVDKNRWRDLIVIPGIVGMVLEVAFDCSRRDIERDGRSGVEIIARPIVADCRTSIARTKVSEILFRVIIPRDPDRCAACLPFVAFRPGLAAGFSRRRHGVSSP